MPPNSCPNGMVPIQRNSRHSAFPGFFNSGSLPDRCPGTLIPSGVLPLRSVFRYAFPFHPFDLIGDVNSISPVRFKLKIPPLGNSSGGIRGLILNCRVGIIRVIGRQPGPHFSSRHHRPSCKSVSWPPRNGQAILEWREYPWSPDKPSWRNSAVIGVRSRRPMRAELAGP